MTKHFWVKLSFLLILLVLGACTRYPYLEPSVQVQASEEDPIKPYLDEVMGLEDEALAALFGDLAKDLGVTENDYVFDEKDAKDLYLHASFLELEYRHLKLSSSYEVPRKTLRLDVAARACAPWLRPQLRFPHRNLDYIFGTSGEDGARDVSVASDDSFAIVGLTDGHLLSRSAGGKDAFICRYAPDGSVLWAKQFGDSGDDIAYGVAFDAQGNSYVVGQLEGQAENQAAFNTDGFARSYDEVGKLVWADTIGSDPEADVAYDVAVKGAYVHVVGATRSNLGAPQQGYIDGYLRQYKTSGTHLGTRQFAYASETYARNVAVDSQGSIYVVGYSLSGSYIGEQFQPQLSQDGFVAKFTPSRTTLWSKMIDSLVLDKASGVRVTSNDDVVVVGHTNGRLEQSLGSSDAFVRLYGGAKGKVKWTRQFGTRRYDVAEAVAIDDEDHIYVVGWTTGSFPGSTTNGAQDSFIRKYDVGGQAIWTRQYGDAGDDKTYSVALNSKAISYSVGQSYQQGLWAASDAAFAQRCDRTGMLVPW